MQDFVTGNVKSYSRILNDEKIMKKIQDYNYLSVSTAILNADKDLKRK